MAAFSTAALVLGLGGLAVQAYGARRSAQASERVGEIEQEAAEEQAKLAEFNATIAELNADDAIQRGQEEEQRFRAGVRGLIGSQRAAYAASNIDVGFGSALAVQEDTAQLGELDALTIRNNAARESWGFKVEAEDSRRRAKIIRKGGQYAAEAGRVQAASQRIGAVGNILGSGGSLLAAHYGFGRD